MDDSVQMKAPKRNKCVGVEVTILYKESEEDKYEVQQYQNGDDAGNTETTTSSS